MKPVVALAPICVLALSAPVSAWATETVPLSELAADPRHFEGQTVRTCGWATNAREDVEITTLEQRDGAKTPGLQVQWLEGARRIIKPTQLCLTGRIERLGGAEGPKVPGLATVVISNGSPYRWRITEISE